MTKSLRIFEDTMNTNTLYHNRLQSTLLVIKLDIVTSIDKIIHGRGLIGLRSLIRSQLVHVLIDGQVEVGRGTRAAIVIIPTIDGQLLM